MKEIYFFDMDNTLLPTGHNQAIKPNTIESIKKLIADGHDVVVATGKSYDMCKDELNKLGVSYSITSNGQVLMKDGQIINEKCFSKTDVEMLLDFAIKNQLVFGVQAKDGYYYLGEHQEDLIDTIFSTLSVEYPKEVKAIDTSVNVYQIWLLGEIDNLDYIPGFNYFKWHEFGLDVLPLNVNKVEGIKMYLEHKNYDNYKTYAFGDGSNDIAMLKFVDVGVAMGNASNEVKAIANAVCGSVFEDGISTYLEKREENASIN